MMSHDSEAAFAYGEIAGLIQDDAPRFFGELARGVTWSLSAGREGSKKWPLADGVIQAINNHDQCYNMAFEYKRPNEGVHGILTAIGQSLAYIEKGYDASVICIPANFASHQSPGLHINNIFNVNYPDAPITVYTYDTPDFSVVRPFKDKLKCVREIDLSKCRVPTRTTSSTKIKSNISTVWAHVREGMSFPDAFFRYCQTAKIISSIGEDRKQYKICDELIAAVKTLSDDAPENYLSSTVGDSMFDKTWRNVWFRYYLTEKVMPIYRGNGPYAVNDVATDIKIYEDAYQKIFSGRSDSIKNRIVDLLNNNPPDITIDDAWKKYAKKIHDTAHSYREVIDSGLCQLGLIDADGILTDYGYKYVNSCEKKGTAYADLPMNILRAVTLQVGQYDVFLSTIFKVSHERYTLNFYEDTKIDTRTNKLCFDSYPYLNWLHDIFAKQLHMLKVSTLRSGGTRKPFQAEIPFLKHLGLVFKDEPFKMGTGLNINWPLVESSMNILNIV